jgi:DHHC palmitoyltransferase
MFDHNCPFVGNTIGLYNYPYFYVFLGSLAFLHVAFIFNFIMFIHRSPTMPWGWLPLGIFHALHVFPTLLMFVYHTQLSSWNLTTNEHMGVSKYEYLTEKVGSLKQYRNPWSKSYLGNLLDRMSPTSQIYLMPQAYQSQYAIPHASSDGDAEKRGLLLAFDDVV